MIKINRPYKISIYQTNTESSLRNVTGYIKDIRRGYNCYGHYTFCLLLDFIDKNGLTRIPTIDPDLKTRMGSIINIQKIGFPRMSDFLKGNSAILKFNQTFSEFISYSKSNYFDDYVRSLKLYKRIYAIWNSFDLL